MRQWWLVALLLSAMMAGCLGGDDADDEPMDDEVDDDHDDMETEDEPEDDGEAEPSDPVDDAVDQVTDSNDPPSATMTASIEQGSIPFNVTFDLDGEDPDGDDLAWTLDVTGDGTAETEGTLLPTNFTWTYDAEGEYEVSFAVTDGTETTTRTLVVNATAAAVAEPEGEIIVHSGGVLLFDPWAAALNGCLLDAGRRDLGGPGGVTGQDHEILPEQYGWSYTLDNGGLIAEFWGDGEILGDGAGQVPDGSLYVVVCMADPSATPAEYTLTLFP